MRKVAVGGGGGTRKSIEVHSLYTAAASEGGLGTTRASERANGPLLIAKFVVLRRSQPVRRRAPVLVSAKLAIQHAERSGAQKERERIETGICKWHDRKPDRV